MDSHAAPAAPAKPPLRISGSASPPERTVAIVGAGFSGTMAAINLRHALPPEFVVHLFERTGRFARGPAYAGQAAAYLLNVRSANMSALPDDPGHFERWLDQLDPSMPHDVRAGPAGRFASRRLYGRYLRALLFEEMRASGGRVLLCADDVVDVAPCGTGWRLTCASGRVVAAAAVVIAAGNLPSARNDNQIVFRDPWRPEAVAGLRPDEPVLIVGTGLTMVDLALAMTARNFNGPILALSRRGLVPQRHGAPGPSWPWTPFSATECRSLTGLLRRVRRAVAEAAAQGIDWRAVVDGLRPITAATWRSLPAAEHARFLRHLRPFWDTHRHRMAPEVATAFDELTATGTLALLRGRVLGIEVADGAARVTVQECGAVQARTLEVQRVIQATGSGGGLEESTLLARLRAAGLATSDPQGLGLQVDERLRLVGSDGAPAANLWALGPIVRGVFWECTAVPDIRLQASAIGRDVAAALADAAAG
jgi:uncharacterized NAD(P)/FAD-binding protein YdhS